MCSCTKQTCICFHLCALRRTRSTSTNLFNWFPTVQLSCTICIVSRGHILYSATYVYNLYANLFFLFPSIIICLKQSEPSLTAKFTTTNDTVSNRYLIGDTLLVNWTVEHMENTSYEDAKSVRVSFYSNTLKISKVTYNDPNSVGQSLTIKDEFHSDEIFVSTLSQGK